MCATTQGLRAKKCVLQSFDDDGLAVRVLDALVELLHQDVLVDVGVCEEVVGGDAFRRERERARLSRGGAAIM